MKRTHAGLGLSEKHDERLAVIETGVSYFGNRWLRHFLEDLDDMVQHGCTYVVHTFSEHDLAFCRRTMEQFLRATRDAALGAWADPWGVMGLFGGEAFSDFAARQLEATQVLSTGQSVPAACPNHPLVRAAMQNWVDAAVEAGADTIFWDEPHFYLVSWDPQYQGDASAWACRCQTCQRLYREQTGEEMPPLPTPEVHAFRKQCLARFLADMSAYASSKGVRNAVCVLPAGAEAMEGLDWEQVAVAPSVDIFGTDPYWYIHDREVRAYVGEQAERLIEVCRRSGKRSHLWVQAFRVPGGREEEISVALELAASLGVEYLAAWGFRGCEAISSIACERPETVWETVGRSFLRLRQGPIVPRGE